jgi:hypothetical protein
MKRLKSRTEIATAPLSTGPFLCRVWLQHAQLIFKDLQVLSAAPRDMKRDMKNDVKDQDFLAWAKEHADHEAMAKALERTRDQVKRRVFHKKALHELIRKFVAAYTATADPDNFNGDIEPDEREDLKKGICEKWAVRRAAEHYGRDERTIREAINPSRRSRGRA